MGCLYPVLAYKSKGKTKEGKSAIYFRGQEQRVLRDEVERIELPCGQCIGCRIRKSREWALRIMHEASLYKVNCFLTLTYRDENMPYDNSLDKHIMVVFIRELRRRHKGHKIRYFLCGEYGEEKGRPHYHLAIFNYNFPDREPFCMSKGGYVQYRSDELEELWPHGYSYIGDLTIESAAYISRYIIKKLNGGPAMDRYILDLDAETGWCRMLEPEYITMSRRPGIGRNWAENYIGDCYPKDYVTWDGSKYSIPKYYERMFELDDPETLEKIKEKRKENAKKHIDERKKKRVEAKDRVLRKRMKSKERNYENGTRIIFSL